MEQPSVAVSAARVRVLYGAYFGFAGIFAPYLSLWLDGRGLTVSQIAWMMALPHALRMVGPPFWGWLADRSGRRVRWLRLSAMLGLVCVLALPWFSSLGALIAVMVVLNFQVTAQMPIGETLALECARGDLARYGRIRLWGSLGFVGTVLLAGPLFDRWGMTAFPGLLAVSMALLAGVAWSLPEVPLARHRRVAVPLGARLRQPAVQRFFVSAFLLVWAHAALYGFLSLFLAHHGYSRTAIGLIWGVGVGAEITMFALQRRMFARWSAMKLLQWALAVAFVRFVLLGVSQGALVWVLLTQLLHAVTFALHHSAAMALLHQWFEPAQQARAQAAYIVVAYGVGATLGGLAGGQLWEHWGPAAVFLGAAVAAWLGWWVVLGIGRMKQKVDEREAS